MAPRKQIVSNNPAPLTLTSERKGYQGGRGKTVPSVTTCIKLIYPFRFPIDQYYLDRGTAVHRVCEAILQGHEIVSIPEALAPYIMAFKAWLQAEGINALAPEEIYTEEEFVSAKGYGGTRDIRNATRRQIIDIKSGVEDLERDPMQLFGYRDEFTNYQLFNLYLRGDGTYLFKRRPFDRTKFRVFLYAVGILNYTKNF